MKYEKYEMRDGNVISIPRPTNYKDCVLLLQSDYYRVCGRKVGFLPLWWKSLSSRSLKVHFWFRMASYRGIFFPICAVIHRHNMRKFDILLSTRAKVGWGFFTGQTTTMFINPAAIIGNNVNFTQMLNIGKNNGNGAIIGDNVYIGPMVCLVEGVQIGSNSTVGAGSVIVKDIPAGSTAVGAPAKAIGENKHPGFIRYPWPCEKCNNNK